MQVIYQNKRRINNNLKVAIASVIVICGTLLLGSGIIPTVSATSQSVSFSVNALNTLTIDVSTNNILLNVTPTAEGVFNSTSLTVGVGTNNDTGYTLSMMTTRTDLYRTAALSNGDYPTISTLLDDNNGNGYTSSSEAFLNHWGYNINGDNTSTNTTYLPVSPIVEQLASSTAPVNSSDATTTINLATKLNNEIPSGTYTTTLNFIAIANYVPTTNCVSNNICYNGNGADVSSSMGNQSATNNTTVTLWASNYKREGYGFAGWSTEQDPEDQDGTNTYGPNQDIAFTNDNLGTTLTSTGLTLYARWIPTSGYMQDFTQTQCTNMSIGDITALTDIRDNNVYTIAKLADSKCWMIENLRLDNNATISTINTNNPLTVNGLVSIVNTYGQDGTDHLSPTSNSGDIWCTSQSAVCYDQSRLNTQNTTNTNTYSGDTGDGDDIKYAVYSYGNYYNWYSATAGNGTYETVSDNPNSATGAVYRNAAGSICPTNWKLPSGGPYPTTNLPGPEGSSSTAGNNSANSDFYQLMYAILGSSTTPDQRNQWGHAYYSSATGATGALRSYPNNFVYSGYWNGSQANNRGTNGLYWPSTAYSAASAYYLHLGSSSVDPGTYVGNKYNGFTARCLVGN